MAGELRRSEERGGASGCREADCREVTRRVRVGRRRVFEGQRREDESHDGDPGDDPEERPPGVRLSLDPAHQRPERYCTEDADVHDHGRVAQLVLREAEGERRYRPDQQQARAEPLDHVPGQEHAGILG